MSNLNDESRLLSIFNRANEIRLLKDSIYSVQQWSVKSHLPPLDETKSYNVYALDKGYVVVGIDKPEQLAKLGASINKLLTRALEGYGPLLVIRYNGSKQVGKHTHSIYEVLQDLQPNYKQDLEQQQSYKQEIEWMFYYKEQLEERLDILRLKREEQGEELMEEEPVITETGLANYIASRRKKETTKLKRRETIARKKQELANESVNNTQPLYAALPTKQQQDHLTELSIDWNNDEPYITTPINAFSNSTANTNTLLHNITITLDKCDTAYIDYTAGASNNHPLESLSDRFCDNIILYYTLPEEDVAINPTLNKWLHRAAAAITTDEQQEPRAITEALKPYLPEHTQKLVRVLNTLDLPITKSNIKPTQPAVKDDKVAQMLKVSLPDVELDKVLKLVSDTATQQTLSNNGFYINDIDITQDFAGLINKREVITYLTTEHDYRLQGSFTNADYTILDNDNKVGRNCLTFLTNDDNAAVRYKFYNKFIQSLESPSVRGLVGNHITDWIENPEQVLRSSIEHCLDTGLLRLEIAFYLKTPTLTKSYLMKHMNYLQTLLPSSLIYHQPIAKQWELYASAISSNLMLLDTDTNTALLTYAINSLSSKINGSFYTNISSNKLSNILKLYTFKAPIYLVLFKRNGNDLMFQSNTYSRELVPNKKLTTLPTYLTSTSTNTAPQTMGLIDLPHISFSYSPKLQLATKQTPKIPIVFNTINWEPLQFPLVSKKQRLNRLAEQDAQLKLIQLHKQELAAIKEHNELTDTIANELKPLLEQQLEARETMLNKLERINNITANRTKLLKLLSTPINNAMSLTTLPLDTRLFIYGIRYTYIGSLLYLSILVKQ